MMTWSNEAMNLPVLVHEPLADVGSTIGENSFAAVWQEHMQRPASESNAAPAQPNFAAIMAGRVPSGINQRCAHVAATFFAWLGTEGGQVMMHQMQTMSAFLMPHEAWIAALALDNRRRPDKHDGTRLMERLLASGGKKGAGSKTIGLSDLDVLEAVVVYLASADGVALLKRAQREFEQARRELALHEEMGI